MKPYHNVRNSKGYSIETVPQTKKYQLAFGKRVVYPQTLMTYHNGCHAALNDQDMDKVNLLMNC